MILNKNIICPGCRSSFSIKNASHYENFLLAECKCNTYPIIEGVLYLNRNKAKKLLSDLSKNHDLTVAKFLAFSFKSKIFFLLTHKLSKFYKLIGFKNFIRLLRLLSFPKGWTKYLLHREKIPSFFLGLLSLDLIKNKSAIVVDLGCGTGNLLPYYYQKIKPQNLIAIDQSFLNLFIAKTFFSKPGTTLICTDLNKQFPIKSSAVDSTYMIDGFHYIQNKKNLLTESDRTLNKSGKLTVIHALNIGTPKDNYALPLDLKKIPFMLKKTTLKDYCLMSNQNIWMELLTKNKITLSHNSDYQRTYAYNIFASKGKLPKELKIDKEYLTLLRKTKINYYQDPDIMVNS